MKFQKIERNAFQVIGIKKECPCGNEVNGIPEFWAQANADGTVDRLAQLINGQIKGVLGITDNYNEEKNTIDYWIAAEHVGKGPDDLLSLEFPKSKWIVFEVHGSAPTAMPEAWRKIFSEWLPANDYELADMPAIEAYIAPNPYKADAINQIWLSIK